MSNELEIKRNEMIIKNSSGNKLSDVIKPLVKEIHLFDTFIAGTNYTDKEMLKGLKENDKLILQREINKYDEKAIMILTEGKEKIGYIPEEDNAIFSRLMDAGKLLTAKIYSINLKGDWYKIKIHIYLMDI